MTISVENYLDDALYGQHSAWSWAIILFVPPSIDAYRGVGLQVAIGNEVQRESFMVVGTVDMDGVSQTMYRLEEKQNIVGSTTYNPIDVILAKLAANKTLQYRLSTGPEGIGPTFDGELSAETVSEIRLLLTKAKYANPMNK